MNKFVLFVLLAIVALVTARRGRRFSAPARFNPVRAAPVTFRNTWTPPPRAFVPPRPVWRAPVRQVSFVRPVTIVRPAPVRWGFNTAQICNNQCTSTRTCTRGGCASWTHYSVRSCGRYTTARVCRRYGAKKVRVCVRGNKQCARWNTINQTSCAQTGVWRKPIVRLVNGGCKRFGKRCAQYRFKKTFKCGKFSKRCTRFRTNKRRICARWSKARSVCAKWGQAPRLCKNYKNICNQFTNKVTSFCAKYGKRCSKWVKKTKVVTGKPRCSRRTKICKKYRNIKEKQCSKYVSNGKCRRYRTTTRKACAERRRTCLKSINIKRRVCKRGTRKCVKYVSQKVGTKCAVWRYNVKKQRRCTRWGRKVIPKQCVAFAKRLRCRAWSTVVSRVNGRRIVTRRCAHSRKVRKLRRGCRFVKRNGVIYKRCGRREYTCSVKGRKGNRISVCCKKLNRIIRPTPRRCIKWAPGRAVRTTCKKWSVKRVRTSYCAKRVNRVRRVCAKTRGVCTQWGFQIKKRCVKSFSKCTQYVNVKTRKCAQFGQKCAKFTVRTAKKCTGYKNKCVQWKVPRVTKTYRRCAAVSRVCRRNSFSVRRVCKNYKRVCAAKTPRRRVCLRYKRVGGKCRRWNTISSVRCVKQQRFCSKPIVRSLRQCARHARFCKAYRRVYKTVGFNRQTYCKRWRVRRIKTSCAAYRHAGCAAWRTRITGFSCVGGYTTKRTCAQQSVSWRTRCARMNPPSCRTNRTCRPVCRQVRIRARGDPFLVVGGKWTQFARTGIFNYFNHGNCKAQLRIERVHQGTQVTGVALKCDDNVFVALPTGVTVNGQPAKSGDKFGNGEVKQVENQENAWTLNTGNGLNVLVTLEAKTNMVNFELTESANAAHQFKDEGLMRGGSEQFAQDYVVPKEENLFPSYVEYSKVPSRVNVPARLRRKAERICRKLRNHRVAFGQCVFDYVQTRRDTSQGYLDELAAEKKN